MTADHDDEFLAAASEAVRRTPGAPALEALGWWEMLGALDDPDARRAVFVLFRAQGRELTDSAGLAALLAHPYLPDAVPGTTGAAVVRRSGRRGPVVVLSGPLPSGHVLVDRPGAGVSILPVADLVVRPVVVPGSLALHEIDLDLDSLAPDLPESQVLDARARSLFLGRVALSMELLGAAETVVDLAVEYVGAREQFGKPIGTFQAVRHLLAWARTDVAAVEAVVAAAVALDTGAPAGFDAVCKALAGRNARRACERTLQCFGGVGFTEEHPHHRFHSRVLAADALLGTSIELARSLGAGLRATGEDPGIPRTLLLAHRR
jgi:alkylation response protein AidB-like acyl-CoA dehydrogenase